MRPLGTNTAQILLNTALLTRRLATWSSQIWSFTMIEGVAGWEGEYRYRYNSTET